jgi:hypothetical protein
MAVLLLLHLGMLASISILGAVSIKASRTIFGAEGGWQCFWFEAAAEPNFEALGS